LHYAPGMPFTPDELDLLGRTEEIRIETSRPDGRRATTIIWVMTDGDQVFVRSVRGERGRWYRDVTADPAVVIHAGDRAIEAWAEAVIDEGAIARCSDAIRRKYAGVAGEREMLEPHTLATTLRLEPASSAGPRPRTES
jgi:hypothetical protein